MGHAVERIFLPLMQKQLPEIIDIHMPFEGIFHNLMLVTIRKRYPGHARKIMNAIWGLGQAMLCKCIVVLDEGTNLQHYGEVLWKALNHIDPERDIQVYPGTGRLTGPFFAAARLWIENGGGRHSQVAPGRLRARVA